jgi:uroporphyrinogen decarboxylase
VFDVFDSEGERIATMPVGATFFDQTVSPYLDGYHAVYRDLPRAMLKVLWSALPKIV